MAKKGPARGRGSGSSARRAAKQMVHEFDVLDGIGESLEDLAAERPSPRRTLARHPMTVLKTSAARLGEIRSEIEEIDRKIDSDRMAMLTKRFGRSVEAIQAEIGRLDAADLELAHRLLNERRELVIHEVMGIIFTLMGYAAGLGKWALAGYPATEHEDQL